MTGGFADAAVLERRSRRVAFGGVMLLTMVAATFLQPAIAVLSPFLHDEFGLSAGQLGLLGSALYATSAMTAPGTGTLVDLFSGKRIALLVFCISGIAMAAFSLAASFGWLFVGAVAGGLANSGGNPSTNHLLARHVAPGKRGLLIGIKQSGVKVSQLLAGALLPAAALAFGWRTAMRLGALAFFAGALILSFVVPAADRGEGRRAPVAGDRAPVGRTVLRLAVFAALMGFGSAAMNFHLPLYAVDRLGLSVQTAGLTAAVMGFLGSVARVLWGPAAERFRNASIPLVILAAGSIVSIITMWSSEAGGLTLLWVGIVGLGLTAAVWNTVANYAIIATAGAHTGRASGLMTTGFVIGLSAGPGLFGFVAETFSYDVGWLLVTLAFVLATLVAAQWWWSERPAGTARNPGRGGGTT